MPVADMQTAMADASANGAVEATVLSGSQTGNAKSVADKLAAKLTDMGVKVNRHALVEYKSKNIATEHLVFLVTSTQGEGEPPEEAVPLYKLLNSKKSPDLSKLEFAVLGLGDSSYTNFCQAGKDFDRRFEELGGKRIADRCDADLNYHDAADAWIEQIVKVMEGRKPSAATSVGGVVSSGATATTAADTYNKKNPFPAALLTNLKITARQAEKDVRHIELDLTGSGLQYSPGDALGVWCENDPALADEILTSLGIESDSAVVVGDKTLDIRTALITAFELTQATPGLVKEYAEASGNEALRAIVSDDSALRPFLQSTPLVDIICKYPVKERGVISAQAFADMLRPISPRLYSIASSPAEVGEEVHLTVGVVRFEHDGKARAGAASSYLADRVPEDETVKVFVERNSGFHLPDDPSVPIIMIGSGTGIAPFRSFVQQRAADEAEGRNWLIFGNQHFAYDFLYQAEWQQFAKDGFLHRYDFAWSRDQEYKIYVQDKIRENAAEFWKWLEDGAYIYVCGDAARMAKDVDKAILDVIREAGKLSDDDAEEYITSLREDKRYRRDVY